MSLIDDHLSQLGAVPRVIFGEPFYFMQSRVLEVPTGVKVRTLREFRDVLSTVDSSVVYLHVVEARGRKGRRRHDFAAREAHLTGVPIADTAVMLETLAVPRRMACRPASPLVPLPA